MIAGPFCGRLLADFGAEVIKVEPIAGDPLRATGPAQDGKSLYAASAQRNKHLVAIDLATGEGQRVVKSLAAKCDVVVENFRPGTLERWGLGYDALAECNAGLILLRISGFGQTGGGSRRPGYGVIGEALSGLRGLMGERNQPPPRMAVPLTDYITGLYGAFGVLAAIQARNKTGRGQVIDLALFEAAFSFMEAHVPAFSNLGIVAERAGSKIPDYVPNDLFPARDGYVHIAAVSQGLFRRLAELMDRPDLPTDPSFATSASRAANEAALTTLIASWTAQYTEAELEEKLVAAEIPASRIHSIKTIFEHPLYREREMLVELPDPNLGKVTVPGIVPKLSETPGTIKWAGRDVGADTARVLGSLAALSPEEIQSLADAGVVRTTAGKRADKEL